LSTFAYLFQKQKHVKLASFDPMHKGWIWDRTYPRGVIVMESDFTEKYIKDPPLPIKWEASQTREPRIIVLHYRTGSPQQSAKAAAAAGATSSKHAAASSAGGSDDIEADRFDVLIPAPDKLLKSPQHPMFPMEPTAWIPCGPSKDADIYITPYHRGLFRTSASFGNFGPLGLSASREPLFVPNSKSTTGPFAGTVRYGSIVSVRVSLDKTGEQELQGVVVLTFVSMTDKAGNEYLKKTADGLAKAQGAEAPPAVLSALGGLPDTGPVAMLAIWPLQRGQQPQRTKQKRDAAFWEERKYKSLAPSHPIYAEAHAACVQRRFAAESGSSSSAADGEICWQTVAPSDKAELIVLRSSQVTRVWKRDEMGSWNNLVGERVSNLLHRTSLEAEPIELDNPAQPTRLRQAIDHSFIQDSLAKYIRDRVDLPESTPEESTATFLRQIRKAAVEPFPVSDLMKARAAVNCAQRVPAPGLHSSPQRLLDPPEEDSPASSTPSSPRPARGRRAAANVARNKTAKQAQAEVDFFSSGLSLHSEATGAKVKPKRPSSKAEAAQSKKKKSAAAATPTPAASALTDKERRAKQLFFVLADLNKPESQAPFAGAVWLNWMHDVEYDESLTTGSFLTNRLEEWKDELFDQLEEVDEQLYHFLLDQTASGSIDVAATVHLLSAKSGRGWRAAYKTKSKASVNVQWVFTDGKQPAEAHGSIMSMHSSNIWHGVSQTPSSSKKKRPAAAPSAKREAAAASDSAKGKGKASKATKRPAKAEEEEKDEEEEESVDLTVVTPKAAAATSQPTSTKRQKLQPTAAAVAPAPARSSRSSGPVVAADSPDQSLPAAASSPSLYLAASSPPLTVAASSPPPAPASSSRARNRNARAADAMRSPGASETPASGSGAAAAPASGSGDVASLAAAMVSAFTAATERSDARSEKLLQVAHQGHNALVNLVRRKQIRALSARRGPRRLHRDSLASPLPFIAPLVSAPGTKSR